MAARSKARKRALDVLFEADQRRINAADALAARLAEPGTQAPVPVYAAEIVLGVVERWTDIDRLISAQSREWSLERMPAVDRAILRIAAWEIAFNPDVPASVAIDEAVSLAKSLSTADSPGFINGVLGAVASSAGGGSEP